MARIVIIGSGIAGLTTALRLAGSHDVTVVTKDGLGESNTAMAQGGIAGVLVSEDSIESHVSDTLSAGAGLSDEAAVRVLCTEGPDRILELAAAGVTFDTDTAGHWARGMEGAHSVARIFHSGGDATGQAIINALVEAIRAEAVAGSIAVREHSMLVDIAIGEGRATGSRGRRPTAGAGASRAVGVSLLHGGAFEFVSADAVVLATGGAGQLFAHTTNPLAATGDGLAAAIRAGADVADLEFFQFHPTALAGAGFLISEAVRGAGAVLLDARGRRFMPDFDRRAELAPRDVVALAIHRTMAGQNGEPCYLDARSIAEVAAHFPSITRGLAAHGLNLATDLIPVTPAAHYFMGGVATDLDGRTSVEGLFAVGEVACTGVHGANRLASNSLLEGAVFGARTAEAIAADARDSSGCAASPSAARLPGTTPSLAQIARNEVQNLAWDHLGVERSETGLRTLLDRLGEVEANADRSDSVTADRFASDIDNEQLRERLETANLTLIAQHIAAHALTRQESRGAHTRTDFPATSVLPTQQPESLDSASTTSLLQESASC